jgi:hypothetical protein
MSLLPDYSPEVSTPAKKMADFMVAEFDRELRRRLNQHQVLFRRFWYTSGVDPQAVFDALGVHAALWLQLGSKDIQDIASSLSLAGQSLSDYIQLVDYSPPRVLTINPDGTVTVGGPVGS